jgi:hypothetical protein
MIGKEVGEAEEIGQMIFAETEQHVQARIVCEGIGERSDEVDAVLPSLGKGGEEFLELVDDDEAAGRVPEPVERPWSKAEGVDEPGNAAVVRRRIPTGQCEEGVRVGELLGRRASGKYSLHPSGRQHVEIFAFDERKEPSIDE